MFFKKEGYPQDSEVVICKVTKVQPHSVFVDLEDYRKSGMLHISEVSPGRIRNIRDYVSEGKFIICKVLKVDEKKGHIDVSLRRINEGQRRDKVDQMKQEQKAEKIIEFVAEQLKEKPAELYSKVFNEVVSKYDYLHEFFNDFVVGNAGLDLLKLPKKTENLLEEVIKQRIKPPIVEIKSKIKIECFESDGVGKVKSILAQIISLDEKRVKVFYLGAGTYMFEVQGEDYKDLEDIYEGVGAILEKNNSKTCFCKADRQ